MARAGLPGCPGRAGGLSECPPSVGQAPQTRCASCRGAGQGHPVHWGPPLWGRRQVQETAGWRTCLVVPELSRELGIWAREKGEPQGPVPAGGAGHPCCPVSFPSSSGGWWWPGTLSTLWFMKVNLFKNKQTDQRGEAGCGGQAGTQTLISLGQVQVPKAFPAGTSFLTPTLLPALRPSGVEAQAFPPGSS